MLKRVHRLKDFSGWEKDESVISKDGDRLQGAGTETCEMEEAYLTLVKKFSSSADDSCQRFENHLYVLQASL